MPKTLPAITRRDFTLGASLLAASLIAGMPAARAAAPTQLRIGLILVSGVENGWEATLIAALERLKAEKPQGLEVSWKASDPLWGDEAGEAMRLYAESGAFDVIWAHSTYSDQVQKLKDAYPEILFVVSGSGNEGLGGNQYWAYKRVHESAYLLGVIAGLSTKTGVIGAVGTFPADDVNDSLNAYFAGARSVRPDIKTRVAFVQSRYDPPKAAQLANAQMAEGADFIYQLAANFQPCVEKNILCFGNFSDENAAAPEVVVSSSVAVWDPDVRRIVNAWWAHKAEGKPYDGNKEPVWFSLAQGGTALAPYHGLDARLPPGTAQKIEELKAKIIDGSLKVPLDVSEPKAG